MLASDGLAAIRFLFATRRRTSQRRSGFISERLEA